MNARTTILAVVNMLGLICCVTLLFAGIDLIVTGLLAFGFGWGLVCLFLADWRTVDRR